MSPQRELLPPHLLPWPYVFYKSISANRWEPSSSWKSQVSKPSHLKSLQTLLSEVQPSLLPCELGFGLLSCKVSGKTLLVSIGCTASPAAPSHGGCVAQCLSLSIFFHWEDQYVSLPASAPAEGPNLRPGWANTPSRASFWWDWVPGPAHVGECTLGHITIITMQPSTTLSSTARSTCSSWQLSHKQLI